MATNRVAPSLNRYAVFQELHDALADHRRGHHIDRLAAKLLRQDTATTELVALVDGAERVVFYNELSHTLEAVAFDEHGLRGDRETVWRSIGDAASWVDFRSDDFDWIHPRYRWVLGLDEEQTSWQYRQ